LPEIIGPDAKKLALTLDKARKIRHTLMYGGEFGVTTRKNVVSLISIVTRIRKAVLEWLKNKNPGLAPDNT
jgi:hypothetical protein